MPHLDVDLVSWSAYDGLNDVVHAWWGVEIIRHFVRPHADGTRPPIFIGEIGYPENVGNKTEARTRQWWDQRLEVFLAQDLPLIIVWQLYCNEPNNGKKASGRPLRAEGLRGFWLVRPNGNLSWSGRYLHNLLKTPSTALDEVQAGAPVVYPLPAERALQGFALSRADSLVAPQTP